jgi:hypothetical protein
VKTAPAISGRAKKTPNPEEPAMSATSQPRRARLSVEMLEGRDLMSATTLLPGASLLPNAGKPPVPPTLSVQVWETAQLRAAQQATLTTTRADQFSWWATDYNHNTKQWFDWSYGGKGPVSTPDLFEVQMQMNHLSQLSEMTTIVNHPG